MNVCGKKIKVSKKKKNYKKGLFYFKGFVVSAA